MSKYFLATALSLCFVASASAQQLLLGQPGQPINESNKHVWTSVCPAGMRAVSGFCNLIEPDRSGGEALHSFGEMMLPDGSHVWQCTWNNSVSAAVQAWCAKIPGG